MCISVSDQYVYTVFELDVKENLVFYALILILLLSPLAQTVASPIADTGIVSLILGRPHTFVEIDREIIFMIFRLPLIQKVLLSVTSESKCG